MIKTVSMFAALALAAAFPGSGLAQSCPATPRLARCGAAAPLAGETVSGTVLQVTDGRTVCVALGPLPDQWVEVRLADAAPGLSREQLLAVAFAREVRCTILRHAPDGVVAACEADGVSVAKSAAAAPAPESLAERL